MFIEQAISDDFEPTWKETFSKREYEYLVHVLNGMLQNNEFGRLAIEHGTQQGKHVLHIYEPFTVLNYLGYMSPSVVSIAFNNQEQIEFWTGSDNGLGMFSKGLELERTLSFPRNSTPEVDFWHFIDAIGDASSY